MSSAQRLLRLASVLGLLLVPGLASAQVVRGRVVDPADGRPVDGAMVVLLEDGGRRRGASLSNATGGFQIDAPGPGRYRLRADRIGYRSVYGEPFELARGDTVLQVVEAQVEAIPLEGIDVEGSRRCSVRPGEGLSTARVWEEARKALAAAEWTDQRGMYRYRLVHHTRAVDRRGRLLEPPDSIRDDRMLPTPFYAEPAQELISEGFVQEEGEDHVYFGPDAAVLLSDVFLDTHCLRLREGRDETEGLLGLEFEPVDERDVPDIRGTLWLDPESSELRWIDYEYVELRSLRVRGDAGGRVVFQGLPNGTWIIRDWEIRMPLMDARRRNRVAGYRIGGGTVVQVRDREERVVLEEESGTVAGVVVDSTGAEPASGALVRLVGTERAVRTDEEGVFYVSGLAEGVHELRATTPLLLASGWEGEAASVRVRPGEMTTVRLRIPSAVTAAVGVCAGEAEPGRTGVVMGTVRDRTWDAFLAGARVRASWPGAPPAESAPELEARTDAAGRYVLCGVPVERDVTLEVRVGAHTATAEIRLPGDSRVLVHDVRLATGGGTP